jgi:hypothetical protein
VTMFGFMFVMVMMFMFVMVMMMMFVFVLAHNNNSRYRFFCRLSVRTGFKLTILYYYDMIISISCNKSY